MHKKLTDSSVAQIKTPASGRIDVWDTLTKAFGIRVSASGSRTWIVAIRRPGARSSARVTLGKFPQTGTAAARAAAAALLTGAVEPPAPRGTLFENLAAQFLAHGRDRKGRPVRTSTTRVYRFVLEQVARPLHGREITKIRRSDIAAVLQSADAERGAATAALARSTLGRFFGWMLETGELEVNPARGTPIYAAGEGDRVLSDAEIAAIWTADYSNGFRSILRLCLLTGARRSEVGGMRWSELDLDAGIWLLPGERTKNHQTRRLPLPPAAVAEIKAQSRIVGRDTVFGSGSPLGHTEWGGHKSRLDRQLGFKQQWVIHDLRRTVRTRLHALSVAHEVIIRLLGHGIDPLARVYDHHDYLPTMRAALEQWAAELQRIAQQPAAKVIALG